MQNNLNKPIKFIDFLKDQYSSFSREPSSPELSLTKEETKKTTSKFNSYATIAPQKKLNRNPRALQNILNKHLPLIDSQGEEFEIEHHQISKKRQHHINKKHQYTERLKRINIRKEAPALTLSSQLYSLIESIADKLGRSWRYSFVVVACVITLIAAVSISQVTPTLAKRSTTGVDQAIMLPLASIINYIYYSPYVEALAIAAQQPKPGRVLDKSILSSYIINNSEILSRIVGDSTRPIIVKEEDLFGRVAGVMESNSTSPESNNINTAVKKSKSISSILSTVKNFIFDLADSKSQ